MPLASWLHGLYVFTAVFGVGVTVVDMLGILGPGDDENGGADAGADTGMAGSVLSILRYFRTIVYFSLGFGPLGLMAEWSGSGALGSLVWAVPGGLVAAVLARVFFRWQHQDIDSSVTEEELLFARGRVIVPLSHRDMGRVRVRMGPVVVERYALAEDEIETFRTDDPVEIVRVTGDCVYVRRLEAGLLDSESW